MIELKSDQLIVSFPELPQEPSLIINFQRTLRIPDDGKEYPLPPGLGSFPLRHIDDHCKRVPGSWLKRGGVLLPMWQSEAMWLKLHSRPVPRRRACYPFAVKVATGKINAITGESWRAGLSRNPQDYLVAPEQPWLDGYCVEKGIIRQFVAMPLGEGYSVEEQLTGAAEFGGLQLEIFPMRPEAFDRHFRITSEEVLMHRMLFAGSARCEEAGMGLAPGGRMRQEIYSDPYSIHDWDTEHTSRCFVHLVNSRTWQAITGQVPPSKPLTAHQYTNAGYPWFDYYDAELKALDGSDVLGRTKSVKQMASATKEGLLPDDQSVSVTNIVNLRAGLRSHQVREGDFDS